MSSHQYGCWDVGMSAAIQNLSKQALIGDLKSQYLVTTIIEALNMGLGCKWYSYAEIWCLNVALGHKWYSSAEMASLLSGHLGRSASGKGNIDRQSYYSR